MEAVARPRQEAAAAAARGQMEAAVVARRPFLVAVAVVAVPTAAARPTREEGPQIGQAAGGIPSGLARILAA